MNEDQRLISRIQAGSTGAFEKLFFKYNNYVYKIAYRLLLNHEDALDISQQVFIRVYQNIDRYSERGKFTNWLSRITINETMTFLRQEKSRSPLNLKHEVQSQNQPLPVNWDKMELSQRIEQALKRLPSQQRIVLVLKYHEEMTLNEIAEELGIALGTVKSHLSRALGSLRRLLGAKIQSPEEVIK